jgi:hypothetical protein
MQDAEAVQTALSGLEKGLATRVCDNERDENFFAYPFDLKKIVV